MKQLTLLCWACWFVLLSGCGGGSSPTSHPLNDPATESPTTQNPEDEPSTQPQEEAVSTLDANTALSYDPDTKIASISWSEGTHPDTTGYLVQKQTLDNLPSSTQNETANWVTIKRLGVGGDSYVVQDTADHLAIYRVIGESDGLVRSGNSVSEMQIDTQITADILASQNGILVNGALNRVVDLTIESATLGQIQKVDYFMDTNKIGSSSDRASQFNLSLNTASYLSGTHRIDAQVFTSANSSFLVKRSVETANSNLAVTLSTVGTQGNVYVVVSASTEATISNVKIYLDDQVVFDGNELNYKSCTRYSNCTGNDAYAFYWDTLQYQPGTYQIKTQVTDSAGEIVEQTRSFLLNNPPEVTNLMPTDGSLISDNLTISGNVSDDELALPLVVVKLGDQTLYSDYTDFFTTSYSMAGLPEKEYVISVTVTDQSGIVTRKNLTVLYKSGAITQTAIANLPENTLVLDIKNGKVLYRDIQSIGVTKTNAHYQNHYLMDLTTGATAQIKTPDTTYAFQIGYHLREDGVLFYSASIAGSDNIHHLHTFMYDKGTYTDLGSKIVDEHTQYTSVSLVGNCTTSYCQYLEPFADNSTDHKVMLSRYNNTYRPGYTSMDLSDYSTTIIPRVSKGGLALVGEKYLVQHYYQYISNYNYYHVLVTDYNNTTLFETTGTQGQEFAVGIDGDRFVYLYWDKSTGKNSLYYKVLTDSSSAIKIVDDYSKVAFSKGITAWTKDDQLSVLKANQTTSELLMSGATIVKFEAGLLIYQKDGKLFQWNSSTNVHQQIWPQNERLIIDNSKVYIYRNNQIFAAQG